MAEALLKHRQVLVDTTDKECGQTPLSLAAGQGNTPIVKLLLAHGADPNARDRDRRTALAWAADNGRSEEVKLLLADTRTDPNLPDAKGWTPLAQAIESGNDIVVRLLLSRPDVDMNAPCAEGITPVQRVYRKGHLDMLFMFDKARAQRRVELVDHGSDEG